MLARPRYIFLQRARPPFQIRRRITVTLNRRSFLSMTAIASTLAAAACGSNADNSDSQGGGIRSSRGRWPRGRPQPPRPPE